LAYLIKKAYASENIDSVHTYNKLLVAARVVWPLFEPPPLTSVLSARTVGVYRVAQKSKLLYCVNSLLFWATLYMCIFAEIHQKAWPCVLYITWQTAMTNHVLKS